MGEQFVCFWYQTYYAVLLQEMQEVPLSGMPTSDECLGLQKHLTVAFKQTVKSGFVS